MAERMACSPDTFLMPRTSASTFKPELYSLAPSALLGTSGVKLMFKNGVLIRVYSDIGIPSFHKLRF